MAQIIWARLGHRNSRGSLMHATQNPVFRGASELTIRELIGSINTSAFERSRWRDGRFACYAPHVMPQGRAFNCDFRFSLIVLSQAKSIGCKRKKIQFP